MAHHSNKISSLKDSVGNGIHEPHDLRACHSWFFEHQFESQTLLKKHGVASFLLCLYLGHAMTQSMVGHPMTQTWLVIF